MSKVIPKTMVMRAYTFYEFVQHGRDNEANIVNGMPWSWKFHECHVSHETDTHYLINTPITLDDGRKHNVTLNVCPWQTVLVDFKGAVAVCDNDVFTAFYERI